MQPGFFIIILVLQSERLMRVLVNPARPFSDDPRRCIRRTIRDCRGYRSSRAVCRFDRCGNRRGIKLRLGCCGRLGLKVRRCLCRYTPSIGGCRPRRSGCFLVRRSSRQVCLGVVTVVFVAGYQSVGLVVFDHDVVTVGETAQFFAVTPVNGGQIAVAVIVVAHQLLAVEGDGSEAVRRLRGRRFGRGRLKVGFQTTSMLTVNEIVKEQMIQTTSKKIVKPSENREEGVKEFYFEINYMRFKIQHIQPLI